MRIRSLLVSGVALGLVALWAPASDAYPTYSQGKVENPDGENEPFGNCKTCHGDFRDDAYKSLSDGEFWSEIYTEVGETEPVLEEGLHDIHRHIMLDKLSRSRCNVCHQDRDTVGRYPVILDNSVTTDLAPISCMGCHGRAEDDEAQGGEGGYGAGLRQHHTRAGIKECKTCHADADPERYTPVGENVLPPYYSPPDPEFPNKPSDSCNPHGEEDYAATRKGLDNDGDGLYDVRDPDCVPTGSNRNLGVR